MNLSDDLYQQLILEHNRKPRNFCKMVDPTHKAEGFNPLCGDHFWVYFKVNQDSKCIEQVSFHGSGCAISKASASMMTSLLLGRTVSEAHELFYMFMRLLKGELSELEKQKLSKLGVFEGVRRYPSRVKCANLAWHAMHCALCEHREPVTTE